MNLRYERKYIIPPDKKLMLDAFLAAHPAGFREIYPPRHVNSLYLDDPEASNWIQSEEGFYDRRKIRIRWYGHLLATKCAPHLEIKVLRRFVWN